MILHLSLGVTWKDFVKNGRDCTKIVSLIQENMVLSTLAWVKHRAELSDVPLLCKEGR
jgi:hypothetical protein